MIQNEISFQAQWKNSESQKSGIFGIEPKKTMIETNGWLENEILAEE